MKKEIKTTYDLGDKVYFLSESGEVLRGTITAIVIRQDKPIRYEVTSVENQCGTWERPQIALFKTAYAAITYGAKQYELRQAKYFKRELKDEENANG
jgi:hypothetical protein